jgi:hypothetical protein
MWILLALLASAASPREHVSFVVLGKTTNHRQAKGADLALLNYHFFAEIFLRENGRVSEASIQFPDGSRQAFEDRGSLLELHGGRFEVGAELDRSYPAGEYRLDFRTPGGDVEGRVFPVRGSRIPAPPRITLLQDGMSVRSVDPAKDLVVTWSEFASAHPDPNGILDPLVFVVIGNCRGERVVHSGRPFEGTPFLTYRAREHRVPAGTLSPGEPHQMFVEHAAVDTSEEDEVLGLVTYASTTFLDFETRGAPAGPPCPEEMVPFDGGQTDRRRR